MNVIEVGIVKRYGAERQSTRLLLTRT